MLSPAVRAAALLAFAALAAALLPDRPAQAQTPVWTATLTVTAQSIYAGCFSSGTNPPLCSNSANLSDNDFTYGGTTYTVTDFYGRTSAQWTDATTSTSVILGFSTTQLTAAKTALGSLVLNAGGTLLAFSDATVGPEGLLWTGADDQVGWDDGDSVALSLGEPVTNNPAPPTGLQATAGDRRVTLSWTNPNDASITSYQVQQKAGANDWGDWSTITGSGATTISHTVTGLTNGTEYQFRIRAVNSNGNSPQSGIAGPVTPQAATTVPEKPTGLKATAGKARVTLIWKTPRDASITSYQVQQKAGSAAWGAWSTITGSGATTTSYTVTGLMNGTAYRFRIRAVNSVGNSPASDATPAVTPRASTNLTPPGNALWSAILTVDKVDEFLGCDNGESRFDNCSNSSVLDDDDFTYGGTTYNVHLVWWDSEDDGLQFGLAGLTGAGTKTALGALALTVGGTRLLVSHAGSSGDTLDWPYAPRPDWTDGQRVSLWLTAVAAPAKPTGLSATRGDKQATLDWSDPGDGSITSYQYQQRTGTTWGSWTTITGSGASTTSHTVTGLANGTAYQFRIRAVNVVGNGTASDAVTVTPSTGPKVSAVAITSTPPADQNGFYRIGDTVAVTFTFDKDIVVTGTPALELALDTATKTAGCARKGASGAEKKQLVCSYTVAEGDADHGLGVEGSKLSLPGTPAATIKDGVGNDATLIHVHLEGSSDHGVDGVRPTATGTGFTDSAPQGGVYGKGEAIRVTVSFDEQVVIAGAASLALDVGGQTRPAAVVPAGEATATYDFEYTVIAGDDDADGVGVAAGNIALPGDASIKDRAGNAAADPVAHPALAADGERRVDTTKPRIGFPPGAPAEGVMSTITLTDANAKIAKYGAILVEGSATDAAECDTADKITAAGGTVTTDSTPDASTNFGYTPADETAGQKICVYAEDAAGNYHAALWSAAIGEPAAPLAPAEQRTIRCDWTGPQTLTATNGTSLTLDRETAWRLRCQKATFRGVVLTEAQRAGLPAGYRAGTAMEIGGIALQMGENPRVCLPAGNGEKQVLHWLAHRSEWSEQRMTSRGGKVCASTSGLGVFLAAAGTMVIETNVVRHGLELQEFRAAPAAIGITVSWQLKNPSGRQCEFLVAWRESGTGAWQHESVSTHARRTSHDITGLEADTAYDVRLYVPDPDLPTALRGADLAYEAKITTSKGGIVTLVASPPEVYEDSVHSTFTARMNAPAEDEVVITLPTSRLLSGTTLTIPAGAMRSTGGITFAGGRDNDRDGPERREFKYPVAYTGTVHPDSDQHFLVYVLDNDPEPVLTISLGSATVAEGDKVAVLASLDRTSSEETTVTVTVAADTADTADSGDYVVRGYRVSGRHTANQAVYTIYAGNTAPDSDDPAVEIEAVDDTASEGPETVTVTATATNPEGIVQFTGSLTLTIEASDGGSNQEGPRDGRAAPPPTLTSARASGAELALAFDTALDESSVPGGGAFSVTAAGAARAVSAVAVGGATATLTLSPPVAAGDAVTVGYAPPASGGLRGAGEDGSAVAAFSGHTATNETPQPLTASVAQAPVEHRGRGKFTVQVAFSEAVAGTVTAAAATIQVTGGTLVRARRAGGAARWALDIRPSGHAAVTLTLPATSDCAAAGAVCTADGRKLESALTHTVPGPAMLSAADARATEGEDATIDFAVTLSRAVSGEVTVRYVTRDATAKVGRDYRKAKGTLTFAAGETAKTLSVTLIDDAKDEGEETFLLKLYKPKGAVIADGEATGTIENDDPMPAAWLARFGRTVAGQAVDAVTGRLEGGGASHVTLGGQQVSLDTAGGRAQAAADIDAVAAALGAGPDEADGTRDRDAWLRGEARAVSSHTMTGRELMLGSAFHLAAGGEAGGPAFAAWGRVAHGTFDGAEDGMTMNGEVTTGFLGADVARERWLAGAAVAVSRGEGTLALAGDSAGESVFDQIEVETTLTSVLPYARIDLNERVTAWGMAGWGTGELTLTEENGTASSRHTADLSMTLGAVGGRGTLVPAPEGGGFALALKTDAFWVRTESDATEGMEGAKGDATRLRLTLDATRPVALGAGALTPSLEVGLRHDGGDAETGTGIELGAGLGYTDPDSGLSMEAQARWLAAHEASDYEEWGVSGSVRLDPGAGGRGLSLTLAPTVGNAASGTGTLWSAADARGLAPGTEFEAARRLDAEVGYGLAGPFRLGTATPYAGLGLADGGARAWRAGVRWQLAPEVSLDLEGTRSESAGADPEQGVMLRGAVRW